MASRRSRRIKVRILNPHRSRSRSRRRRKHTNYGRVRAHRRRVNPVFGRRLNRRRRRSNPAFGNVVKRAVSAQNIIRYLAMGGGFYLGTQVSGFLSTGRFFGFGPSVPPGWTATIRPARPAFGVVHMILGAFIAARVKNPLMRDAGIGVAVSGGYDVVQQVSAMLLPRSPSTAAGISMQRSMLKKNGMSGVSMARSLLSGTSMPRRAMADNAMLEASMG